MALLSELIEKYTSYEYELVDLTLATGAGRICALRGWIPAQAGHTQDQGLIVAYLKSGVAYYRNYALQENETYIWESEKEIAELPAGLTDIALFRTNDFRIGVLGRDSVGQVHMTVTVRNYAGMSVFPEFLNASVSVGGMSIALHELVFTDVEAKDETITAETTYDSNYAISLCPVGTEFTMSAEKTSSTSVTIEFNYPVIHGEGQASGFTADGNRTFDVMTIDGNKIHLTLDSESPPFGSTTNYTLLYDGSSFDCPIVVQGSSSCFGRLLTFEVEIPGIEPQTHETMTTTVTSNEMEIEVMMITFTEAETQEENTVTASVEVSDMTIQMLDLNESPI